MSFVATSRGPWNQPRGTDGHRFPRGGGVRVLRPPPPKAMTSRRAIRCRPSRAPSQRGEGQVVRGAAEDHTGQPNFVPNFVPK